MRTPHLMTVAAAATALLTLSGSLAAQMPNDVTYARDVAPIIQDKCQACHTEGSIGPMTLNDYDDVVKSARRIRQRVENRIMPPWHIDRTVGIQEFKNDSGLSDEEIATVLAWIDADMPLGDENDLPAPRDFSDTNAWQYADNFGEPDMIVRSDPYTLAAETQDKWWRPEAPTGLTEPRWVKAIEMRPSYPDGRSIVHHALSFLIQDEGEDPMGDGTVEPAAAMGGPGLFMEWAVGKTGEIFPDGAGKLMLPDSKIRWEVHYHAMGRPVENSFVEMGIWFYPEGEAPRNRTRLKMFDARGRSGLDIPPGEVSVTQDFHVLQWPTRLENFQPHMHMRGKTMTMEAVYPDGRKEILSQVNNFQWQWHVNYIYADHAAPLLPAGTTVVITAWHDNTENNPNNPDPTQWVGWGDRTVDEMAHAWVDVTYLSQEEYDSEVAKREVLKAEASGSEGRNR